MSLLPLPASQATAPDAIGSKAQKLRLMEPGRANPPGEEATPRRILLSADDVVQEVKRYCHTDFLTCVHCRTCANACPFNWAMDHTPHQLIRLVRLGFLDKALRSSTLWTCVGCHTCSSTCPNSIDIPSFMDALRHLALKEGVDAPGRADFLKFHSAVLRSVEKNGRAHKLGIMLRYKAARGKWTEDFNLGLKMFTRRKLELNPHKIVGLRQLANLFKQPWR